MIFALKKTWTKDVQKIADTTILFDSPWCFLHQKNILFRFSHFKGPCRNTVWWLKSGFSQFDFWLKKNHEIYSGIHPNHQKLGWFPLGFFWSIKRIMAGCQDTWFGRHPFWLPPPGVCQRSSHWGESVNLGRVVWSPGVSGRTGGTQQPWGFPGCSY